MSVGTFPYWSNDDVFINSPDPFYRQNKVFELTNTSVSTTGIGTINSADTLPTTVADYLEFNAAGGFAQALRYTDGSDRFHVTIPYSIEFEFYCYTPNSSDQKWLATSGEGYGIGWAEWVLYHNGQNGTVDFASSSDNVSNTTTTSVIYNLQLFRWYKIGLLFATGKVRFYVNGQFVKEVAMASPPYNSTNGLAIAGDNRDTGASGDALGSRNRRFQGRIRNFRMGQALWWQPNDDIPGDPIYTPPLPMWMTGEGYLTSLEEHDDVNIPLIIEDPEDSINSYQIVSGLLPPGLSLNLLSGVITGTVLPVLQDERYTFTVAVTYGDIYSVMGTFELLVIDQGTEVNWVTPAGSIGQPAPGEPVMTVLEATST